MAIPIGVTVFKNQVVKIFNYLIINDLCGFD
jgi:hypothetical protein